MLRKKFPHSIYQIPRKSIERTHVTASAFSELAITVPLTEGGALSTPTNFEVLALALDAAGLIGTVACLSDFMPFAPTDEAFASLALSTGLNGDTSDATAVFTSIAGTLASLDSDGDPIPLLTDILRYHVSPDSTPLADLSGAGEVDTLFDGEGFQVTDVTVVDADPDAINADIVAPDIATNTGTVQVVDQVLLPVDISEVDDLRPTDEEVVGDDDGGFGEALVAVDLPGLVALSFGGNGA
ncbi:MAG: fasciclin domain-containing protein [Pseudomonadota bacterium]